MNSYHLQYHEYTLKNSLYWGNFSAHLHKATQGSLGERIVHAVIALIEAPPILGQIASLFESIIALSLIIVETRVRSYKIVSRNSSHIHVLLRMLAQASHFEQFHRMVEENLTQIERATLPDAPSFFLELFENSRTAHEKRIRAYLEEKIQLINGSDLEALTEIRTKLANWDTQGCLLEFIDSTIASLQRYPCTTIECIPSAPMALILSYLSFDEAEVFAKISPKVRKNANHGIKQKINEENIPLRRLVKAKTVQEALPFIKKHKLSTVNFREFDLRDENFHKLKSFTFITKLNLSHQGITTQGLSLLADLDLVELDIRNCPCLDLPGQDLSILGNKLRTLRCSNLTDTMLAQLKSLQLTTFELYGGHVVTNAGLTYLRNMPLKRLLLNDCNRITDAGLAPFEHMELEELDLKKCMEITDQGLAYFRKMRLRVVNIAKVRNAGISMLENMPLIDLDLSRNLHAGIIEWSTVFKDLRSLNLNGCMAIEDPALPLIAKMRLNKLILASCNITDKGLFALRDCPLEFLDIAYCHKITNAGLGHLTNLKLRHLNLFGLFRITDDGLNHLESMPLNWLNIRGCYEISDAGLFLLRDHHFIHLDAKGLPSTTREGFAPLKIDQNKILLNA